MSFASDFVSNVKSVGNIAGKKATELAEQAKVRFTIVEMEGELDNLYRRLGSQVYLTAKGESDGEDTEAVIREIDVKRAQLAERRGKLNQLRNVRICKCGAEVPKDATFCSKCGGRMD